MTMFDNRLAREIQEFGENYTSKERIFRGYIMFAQLPDDGMQFNVKANGRVKEFFKMSHSEYESCMRRPIASARQGTIYGMRYFAWHYLAEQNQLDLFFNTLKELQNA